MQEIAAEATDAGQTDHLTMVRRIRERVDALLRLAQLEVRPWLPAVAKDLLLRFVTRPRISSFKVAWLLKMKQSRPPPRLAKMSS